MEKSESLYTSYFTVTPGIYVRHALWLWMGRWWAVFLPVPVCVVAALWDWRLLILALILLLIAAPMVLALVYFHYALSPEVAAMLTPHRVALVSGRLTVEYESGRIQTFVPGDFSGWENNGSQIILFPRKNPVALLIIPCVEIPDKGWMEALTAFLDKI